MRIVLLPGLDGTAKLFNRFIAAAPPDVSLAALALPSEDLTYEQLADRIDSTLPEGQIVLVAESFSGPLALALTERRIFAGVVLCNSFVVAPRPWALRWLALPALFTLPLPDFLLRRYMVGAGADDALVRALAAAVASVPSAVLASRVRSVLTVDAMNAFARSAVPILYLRGTEDRLVPDSAVRGMAAARHFPIARVPGPHLLLQANPVGAWEAILPFLDSLRAT